MLVTGASGRTGQLVLEALLNDKRYEPRALVRSEASAKKLRKAVKHVGLDQIIVCDITTLQVPVQQTNDKDNNEYDNNDTDTGTITPTTTTTTSTFRGISKIIICSSAVPVLSKRSLLLALLKIPWNFIIRQRKRKKLVDFRSLRFKWKQGQYPELVDYKGQVALIDLAKQCQMDQVVVVGSMGGSDPNNFLNAVGKNGATGHGDILLWKRKGEKYLVESSSAGLNYCIIHPGGLLDTPAGQEEFVLDVDDVLFQRTKRSISRADVANLCVAALSVAKDQKVALDCITQPLSEDNNNKSQQLQTADQALKAFLESGKKYNYEK